MDSEESTVQWLLVQRIGHGVETQGEHLELFRGLSAMRVRTLWLGSEIHNALDACGWLALDCLRFEDVAARSGRLDLLQRLHDFGYFKAAQRCSDDDTDMCAVYRESHGLGASHERLGSHVHVHYCTVDLIVTEARL
jgi:hypothetical protein